MNGKAFTQITRGQFLLGGSIRFESVKENYNLGDTYKETNFFLSPDIGYFFLNKMAGGVRIDFSSYKLNSSNVEWHKTTTAISPFVRYYFLPVAAKVNAFLDVGYLHSKSKWHSYSDPAYSDKSKGFQVLVGPSIFLTDQIALEFALGYRHTKSDEWGSEPTESATISSGLGLQIHLGKKRQQRTR